MNRNDVMGVVFANVHDDLVSDLTAVRSMASIPFGGRYRLIDFSLSNLVNAGISRVGVIPKFNYHSLMDHLGSGKPWDLDRKSGGLSILPPYLTPEAHLISGHVDSLDSIRNYLERSKEKYIVLCDADVVSNIDLQKMLDSHFKNNADITIAYKHGKLPKSHRDIMSFEMDENKKINKIIMSDNFGSVCDFSLDVIIMQRTMIMELVRTAREQNASNLWQDVFQPRVNSLKIFGYEIKECAWVIDSPTSYAQANFSLLDPKIRNDLFAVQRPVYTKVRDDVPTRYGLDSKVSDSLIADGCVIEGRVENCVIFRGVRIEKGAVLKNCIIMQDTVIKNNVNMDCVITDKNVTVSDVRNLCGVPTHYMFIKKHAVV